MEILSHINLCKFKIMKSKTFFYNDEYQLKDFAFSIAKSLEPHTDEKLKLNELPFRLQQLSKNIINDSKSTNSSSLYYAIEKLNFSGVLIMCGNPNKENYQNLIINGPAKVLIFGKHREDIKKRIIHKNIKLYSSLESLVSSLNTNDQILFSPGNPSGDDFSNFMERVSIFPRSLRFTLIKNNNELFDRYLVLPFLALTCLSLVFIYSSSNVMANEIYSDPYFFFKRQLLQ